MQVRSTVTFFALFCLIVSVATRVCAVDPPTKNLAPDANAEAEATKLVKEVYGSELAAAKTPAQKQALAKTMLRKGRENGGEPSVRFILFRLSRDIAVQAPDVGIAFEAIAELDKAFVVDGLEMKSDTVTKMATLATSLDSHKAISQKAAEVADESIIKGNYLIAKQVNDVAVAEARKSNDASLLKQSVERKTRIEEMSKAFEAAKAAIDVLDKTPLDPAANLTVGKYFCFAEGNWKKGLPMLVMSGDPAFKPLAETELKGAASSEEQAKLADRWWDLAEAQGRTSKKQIQGRAIYWYKQALPGLTGLVKDKVAKRIAEQSEEKFMPLDSVAEFFALAAPTWKKEESCLTGNVGNIDNEGTLWSERLSSAAAFEFGFAMKAKWYQKICVRVDDHPFIYSRGHWANAGTLVFDGTKEVPKLPGTVTSPDKWVSLLVKGKGNSIEFWYDGKIEWKGTLPAISPEGKHLIQFGFGSHETTVSVKDMYLKLN